jgi:cobalt-zinc-cadmium efflux system protein
MSHDHAGHDHHGHDHHGHDHHGHSHARGSDRRRLILTLAVTVTFLVAEVIGGLLSHSLSLLSDAGHMLSDVVAQVLALAAIIIATRPADARRTYGWYRLEILAALGNGLILLVLAGSVIWKAAFRLHEPVHIESALMTSVAGLGLLANLLSAWLLHGSTSLNMRGAYLHILMDTLSSVTVLIGGIAIWIKPSLSFLDPILSMLIGLFIVYTGYRLLREAVDVLLEAVPKNLDLARLTHALDHVDGVLKVHDLHVWTITSGRHALSAHVMVAPGQDRDAMLDRLNTLLTTDFDIQHVTIQIELNAEHPACHAC